MNDKVLLQTYYNTRGVKAHADKKPSKIKSELMGELFKSKTTSS